MQTKTNFRPQPSLQDSLQPLFEIVILSYNHPEHTARCVQSVLDVIKKMTIDKKIFLIHNGSEKKHTQQLMSQFDASLVEHIVIESNKGFSGGANYGLKKTFTDLDTDWILFLTNDTELVTLGPPPTESGLFSITLHKRKLNGSIDSIMGSIDLKCGQLKHIQSQSELSILSNQPNHVPYVPGTAFWIHKDIFSTTSGFDECFHTYWEDVDLSYRIYTDKKYKIDYHSSTVAIHKIGKTCHKNDFYTYFLFQRNRKRFMIKHKKASLLFWVTFIFNVLKHCKGRWHYFWRIIYE